MIFKNILLLSLAMASFISCTSNTSGVKATTTVSAIIYIDEDMNGDEKLYKYDPATGVNAVVPGNYVVSNYWYDDYTLLPSHNGKVYVQAGDGTTSYYELWVYDLRTNTMSQLADLQPGNGGGYYPDDGGTAFIGDKLYFLANDGTNGSELWVYDTTVAISTTNPKMVFNQTSGFTTQDLNPDYIKEINGKIYFRCKDSSDDSEMCIYDPNLPDTVSASTVDSNTNPKFVNINVSGSSQPQYFVGVNGKIYFSAHDGSYSEMYQYDGTAVSLVTAADTSGGSAQSSPYYLSVIGNKIFYRSQDSSANNGLYVYDTDTPSTNASLIDLNSSGAESVRSLTVTSSGVYAIARGASGNNEVFEITNSTPRIISPLVATATYPDFVRALGDKVYFHAYDPAANNGNAYGYVFDPAQPYLVGTNPKAFSLNDFSAPTDFTLVQYSYQP